MLDVLLLIAKILFYSTCASYIRELYRKREYVPHEDYIVLRDEYNRIVEYNKELKLKLLQQQYDTNIVQTTMLNDNSKHMKVVNSVGDLYLTQDTGEIYVKVETIETTRI